MPALKRLFRATIGLQALGAELGVQVESFQTNSEAAMCERIHRAFEEGQDAVLIKVRPQGDGGACHVGFRSCFYRVMEDGKLVERD